MSLLTSRPGRATARFFTAFHDLLQSPACPRLHHTRAGLIRQETTGLASRGQHNDTRSSARGRAVGRKYVATAARQLDNTEGEAARHNSQEKAAADTEAYKAFMRSVASPVAVVTAPKDTTSQHNHAPYAQCIGATISSLTSVCIRPSPILSFNLHENSGTASSIVDSNALTVHILRGDKNGESIASAFANPIKQNWYEPFETVAGLKGHRIEVDQGGHVSIHGPGVVARAHCNLAPGKTVNIGDHLVMFANVLQTELAESRGPGEPIGLSFAQGVYQQSTPLDATPDLNTDDFITRQAPPTAISHKGHGQMPRPAHLAAAKRHYSTSTTASSAGQPPSSSSDSSDPFLKQTIRDYLSLPSMPKHRWRNQRALAELDRYGRARIALAIAGGTPEAPPGSQPGGQTNHIDARIRTLIERLHSANKLGHVPDAVMEELVLSRDEGQDGGK